MLARHFPFGRIPQLSLVALCSLAAGWSAGRHLQFVSLSHEELSDHSPPYSVDEITKAPAFLGPEARLQPDRATEARPNAIAPPDAAASGWIPDQGLDLTGFSEALGFYKSGDLAQGDRAAAAARDKTVKTALEWVALRRFPREAGAFRLRPSLRARAPRTGTVW